MNRKAETFFDAITLLREDLVEEAQSYVFRKRRSGWRKFGSLAACVALVMSLGLLAALPRGCGGASKDFSNMNSSGAAPTSPAEPPPNVNEDTSYGDGSGAGVETAPAAEPSGEGAPPAEAERLRFSGQILEVLEDGLLVEPFDSFLADLGPVYVSTAGLEDLPEFYQGGTVMVLCGAVSQGDGGAAAEGILKVELLEPEAP